MLTQEEVQALICVIKNSDKYASAGFSISVSGGGEEDLGTIQFAANPLSAAAKISKRQKGYWSKVKRIASKENVSIAQARKIVSEAKKKKSA
jgi:uncharacterized protein YaiL (DUF2058 family)